MTIDFELHGEERSLTPSLDTTDDWKTAAEAAAKARPWFMAVSLASRPRCFGCGGRMLPKVVRIQANHALCEACSTIDWSDYRPYWRAIESLGCPLEITTSRGIVFWTPPHTLKDVDGYLRWMELWEIKTEASARSLVRRQQAG